MKIAVHAMFMASGNPSNLQVFRAETASSARFRHTPIFMGCWGAPPRSMYIRVGCGDRSVQPQGRLKQERCHVEQIEMGESCRRLDALFNAADAFPYPSASQCPGAVFQTARPPAALHR